MTRDETVVVVDENNHVIGAESRYNMRTRGLIHRAAYILVFNSSGDIFVQKRTLTKDVYPGYYDVATGGVVLDGETYQECAKRELEEELGIRDVPLAGLFDFFHTDSGNKVWGRAYKCVYDGDMVLQDEEVESGKFRDVGEVIEMADHQLSTPDGLYVLRRYVSDRGILDADRDK